MDTVIIGCKLPNGYVIEVGYTVEAKGADGKMFSSVRRDPEKYARVELKGWHSNNPSGLQMPATFVNRHGITRNVSKLVWDRWKKEHANSPLLKNGVLFEAANEADAQVKAGDMLAVASGLEPMKQEGDSRISKADKIERADFTKVA